jgi:hypothetical protein
MPRYPKNMNSPSADLEDEQHVDPAQQHGEEVTQVSIVFAWARQNSLHDAPLRRGAGSSPARRRTFQTVAGATR